MIRPFLLSARPHPGRALLALAALLLALPPLSAQVASRNADDDWRSLQSLIARDPARPVAAARTAAERAAARQERATRLQEAAAQARDFHTRHPAHPHAPHARRIAVTALIESARLGAVPVASALDLAATYRAESGHLREHRFEVALAAERLRQLATPGPGPAPADEALADTLRREFGPIPEVHGLYAGLAARAGMEAANRLATKLLEMRPPAPVKAAAEAITTRYGLVGRPLALHLTRLDATSFELPARTAAAGPTVLYVWVPGHGPGAGPFAALASLRGKLPPGVTWIYLGLGVAEPEARLAAPRAPFAGTHCRDDAGPRSALAQRLAITASPTVFVLDRQGVVSGFGRVADLPELLSAATR